jgi:glutathione-regulated potassium-efflux system ancillary protein KefG
MSRPDERATPEFRQRVLVLFAHPAYQHSRVQRALAAAARGVEGIEFHDLYEAYPDFDIDVRREQALLADHDLVVLQHPLYWYSTPPLVKQWFDLVLEYGWAYGAGGTALAGKRWLCAISTGGSEEAYRPEALNRFTLRELLAPVEQTLRFCGARFLEPFVVYGTHAFGEREIDSAAKSYSERLRVLRDAGTP